MELRMSWSKSRRHSVREKANAMILNAKKNVITYISKNDDFSFNRFKLLNSYEKKILGSAIDNEPKIEPHIKNVCKKAEQNEKY